MSENAPHRPQSVGERRDVAFGAGVSFDPVEVFERLRLDHPVQLGGIGDRLGHLIGADLTVLPERERFSIFGHAEAVAVLRDAATFSSRWFGLLLDDFVGPSVISFDEPEHRRLRLLLQPAFARGRMQWWRTAAIGPAVTRTLDRVSVRSSCDLVDDVGAPVAMEVILGALGLPPKQRAQFFEWAVTMISPAESRQRRTEAGDAVAARVLPLIAQRREAPKGDLLSVLARASIPEDVAEGVDTRPLADDEITSFVRLLIIAGADTTARAFGTTMYQLLRDEALLATVRADPSTLRSVIEESLRLEPPVAVIGRLATTDTTISDVDVPSGCPVNVSLAAANRDPARWADPHRFDAARNDVERHLAFSTGPHTCLGAALAREELAVMCEQTLTRLRHLRLDPSADDVCVTGVGFRMVTRLPVLFNES